MHGNARKVIILGSGPAGMAAAIYAARANLEPLVLEGVQPGGQLTITTDVENYPGFVDAIMGPELMEVMKKQAGRFGTQFEYATVDRFEQGNGIHRLYAGKASYECHALIIATGASAKWLGLDNEQRLQGHGVSACATCDGFFFKNKRIAVVGGGDTAMEEATFLTKFGSRVSVIHRRDRLRASKAMQERALKNPKIEFIWDTVVTDVMGSPEKGVSGLKLQNLNTKKESTFECEALFIAIGHVPNTDVFQGHIEMDGAGYIKTRPFSTLTSATGVFAAGDAADKIYRQAVTAAGTGCMAALDAERYLAGVGVAD